MKWLSFNRRFFDFIIFSNLFIAACAVLMVWQTWYLFSFEKPTFNFLGLIFSATLSSYSIHWYLTDENTVDTAIRTNWLSENKPVHLLFFLVSVSGCFFFITKEISLIRWLLPAVTLTILYSAPKLPYPFFKNLQSHIWGKTILLALMWTYVTAVLPMLLIHTQWQTNHIFYIINRFALIFPICILFDLRDKESDKEIGIKSIVTAFPENRIRLVYNIFIAISIFTSFLHLFNNQRIIHSILLAIPAIVSYFIFPKAISTKNDYLFYFALDGLMALSAILFLVSFIYNIYF